MNQQQNGHLYSNENGVGTARTQDGIGGKENSCARQLHELARLRIERNRAARHARCTAKRKAAHVPIPAA